MEVETKTEDDLVTYRYDGNGRYVPDESEGNKK
jgi:hypothetical protein